MATNHQKEDKQTPPNPADLICQLWNLGANLWTFENDPRYIWEFVDLSGIAYPSSLEQVGKFCSSDMGANKKNGPAINE